MTSFLRGVISKIAFYAGMTENDLSAIYTYLQSLKSVKNKVERFTANE
jgi:hypothetical protein